MATQIIGSFAINNLLPIQARPAGSVSFGPFAIPAGYTALGINFDLQQVNSLTAVFSALIEVSFDSGAAWQTVGGGPYELDLSASGYRLVTGQLMRAFDDPVGSGPVRVFGSGVKLVRCDMTTRQVRGTITCSEALISGVTLVGS